MTDERDVHWPDFLPEREPANDVERIADALERDGIKIKSKLEGELTADMKPGDRLRLHWSELAVELRRDGLAAILVEGEAAWTGPLESIEHIHTYSRADDETLCGVAINGKVVWLRQ